MTKSKVKNLLLMFVLLLSSLTGLLASENSPAYATETYAPRYLNMNNQYKPVPFQNPYSGAGVNLSSAKTVTRKSDNKVGQNPFVTTTYKPVSDGSNDPWKGGTFTVDWTGLVDIVFGGGSIASAATGKGFAFVAHVNLPDTVDAHAVVNAMEWNTAVLTVEGTSIKLTRNNFEVLDNHTLRLTMKNWNGSDITKKVWDVIWGIVVSRGLTLKPLLNDLYVNFKVDVLVDKMTADGAEADTSPGKILTTGKFPPAINKKVDLSVDFYGADQIIEDKDNHVYAKLPNDDPNAAFPISKRSSYQIDTWNSYISPWDNQQAYNLNKDDGEAIVGNESSLLGGFGNRSVDIQTWKESFADMAPERFNRVVNIFSKENVTSGSMISHTPANVGLGTTTTVLYKGKDAEGTDLSPATLTVKQDYVKPSMTLNNLPELTGLQSYSIVAANSPIQLIGTWTAPNSQKVNLHYRIYDMKNNNKLYPGREDLTFYSYKNTSPNSIKVPYYATIEGLPEGFYYVDRGIQDNYSSAIDWRSGQIGMIMTLPALVVVDMPSLIGKSEITNVITGNSGQRVEAGSGDTINEKVTYEVKTDGKVPVKDSIVKVGIPDNAEYSKGSLTVKYNGEEETIETPEVIDGYISIPILQSPKKGDEISVSYSYVLKQGLKNQVIKTKSAQYTGKASVNLTGAPQGEQEMDISPVLTNTNDISIPDQVLKLTKIPTDFSFGEQVNKPYIPVTLKMVSNDNSFVIMNTFPSGSQNDTWHIDATLEKAFQTEEGDTLDTAKLMFKYQGQEKEILPNVPTTVIKETDAGRGSLPISPATDEGLEMKIAPDHNIKVGKQYSGEIVWSLSQGPGN